MISMGQTIANQKMVVMLAERIDKRIIELEKQVADLKTALQEAEIPIPVRPPAGGADPAQQKLEV